MQWYKLASQNPYVRDKIKTRLTISAYLSSFSLRNTAFVTDVNPVYGDECGLFMSSKQLPPATTCLDSIFDLIFP